MTDREKIAARLAGQHAKYMNPYDIEIIERLIRDAAQRAWMLGTEDAVRRVKDHVNAGTVGMVTIPAYLPADFELVGDGKACQQIPVDSPPATPESGAP